jgi:ankyrin repeat protein
MEAMKIQMDEMRAEMKDMHNKPAVADLAERIYRLITADKHDDALLLMEQAKDPADVTFQDCGGMTPLHRGARCGNRHLVRKILRINPEAANLVTYPSRAPGLWTPLHCIADTAANALVHDADVKGVVRLLVQAMSQDMIGQQNTSGNTAIHLGAARGHTLFVESIMPELEEKFGTKSQIITDIVNTPNKSGKGCVDMAVYNTPIRKIIEGHNGRFLLEKPGDWDARRLPHQDHKWHRSNRDNTWDRRGDRGRRGPNS